MDGITEYSGNGITKDLWEVNYIIVFLHRLFEYYIITPALNYFNEFHISFYTLYANYMLYQLAICTYTTLSSAFSKLRKSDREISVTF